MRTEPVEAGHIEARPQLNPAPDGQTHGTKLPAPFSDPFRTADGSSRASVAFQRFEILWFNTGSLCNLSCPSCYIESSPSNDRLGFITQRDLEIYLDELDTLTNQARSTPKTHIKIGFTGGEPFVNPEMPQLLEICLKRGHYCLVLSNAMRPMRRFDKELTGLAQDFPDKVEFRISLDHFEAAWHDYERGSGSFAQSLDGIRLLQSLGFEVTVAGRLQLGKGEETLQCREGDSVSPPRPPLLNETAMRQGYSGLFTAEGITIDAWDPASMVLFPEMHPRLQVPEISTDCWNILGKSPSEMMCSNSRMVLKRKGTEHPVVVPCTLLPYDPRFELSERLGESLGAVQLNHPYCAQFCVLGGASCSPESANNASD